MLTKMLTDNSMSLEIAADFLREGKTVVFPTETVYGLGANALDEKAVKKIFKAKGRPSDNPLIVHISSIEMLEEIADEISDKAKLLMDKFWPGPLTLIFKKKDSVPRSVTGGLSTVAVRFPSNNVAYELIERAGIPIAAPSANISGRPSPTRFSHSYEDLNGRVDAMIKSKPCEVGVESTVLDVSGDVPVLLRPGMITLEEISELIGEVKLGSFDANDTSAPMSPGMKYKHYAPKAEVIILKGSREQFCDYVKNELKKLSELDNGTSKRSDKLAVLNFKENIADFDGLCTALSLGSVNFAEEVTANLFNSLRELDDLGMEMVYAPEIPNDGIWRAVQNRLYKAAGGNIIDLDNENLLGQTEKSEDDAKDALERINEEITGLKAEFESNFADKADVEVTERMSKKNKKTDKNEVQEVMDGVVFLKNRRKSKTDKIKTPLADEKPEDANLEIINVEETDTAKSETEVKVSDADNTMSTETENVKIDTELIAVENIIEEKTEDNDTSKSVVSENPQNKVQYSSNLRKILFICTGNTCRSPMAEGLFNSMASKEGLDITATSAGTYAYNNLPVSENSVKAMKEVGLDISQHKSRQITREMLNEADLVLTMTEEHSEFLNAVVPEHSNKIMTVAKCIDLDISVEDPYGDRLEEYIRCRSQLEKIIKLIIRNIKKAEKAKRS